MKELSYLTKSLSNGRIRAVCTIGIDKKITYCMYDSHNSDGWEPPCIPCTLSKFYSKKTHLFLHVAWKGTLVREDDDDL